MDNSHRWANAQVKALIDAGVNPLDAQRSVTWVLAHVPVGADPNTWMPSVDHINTPLDAAAVQDARAAFYERAPTRFKRILDAVTVINA